MSLPNPTICNNMDGARGCYAQWNKPGRERQVPNDFTHLWSIRTKRKMKKQNSSRFTEPKKGTGEDGWEGRDKGENGELQLAHIM